MSEYIDDFQSIAEIFISITIEEKNKDKIQLVYKKYHSLVSKKNYEYLQQILKEYQIQNMKVLRYNRKISDEQFTWKQYAGKQIIQ